MLFLFAALISEVTVSRHHKIMVKDSSFTKVFNSARNKCVYRDNKNAPRYTRDCSKVYDNSWNGIRVDSRTLGGAISTNSINAYVEMLRNTFTLCKAKSGGACALCCSDIHFNLNTVDRCETVSTIKDDGDGAVYVYCEFDRRIRYTGSFTQYIDCNFWRGGGLETKCNELQLKLVRDTFTRCRGTTFGGGIHINNLRGTNEFEDCNFIRCHSLHGGAIGYDVPKGTVSYSIKVFGCFIDACSGKNGMVCFGAFRSNAVFDFIMTKSRLRKSRIIRCENGDNLFFINAQKLVMNNIDFQDTKGNVLMLNRYISGYILRTMNLVDCSFVRCLSRSSNEGLLMAGSFGVVNVERCRFEDVTYLWNFYDVYELRYSNCAFRNVHDPDKTNFVTKNPRFSILFESITFFDSSMHVSIVTTVNTANMNTRFRQCRFESMSRKIFVKMPSNIEVIGCNIDGNALRFSGNSKSLTIRDCTLTVRNQGHALITIESTPRTALSEIRNCTFAVNAGQAIVINGLVAETTMKLFRCQFNGNSANHFISVRGNLLLEGNTFRPPTSRTNPLFRFIDGKLIFSNSVKNCVFMPFKRAISVDNPRLYEQVVDENGRIVERWTEHSNLCFLDSTDQFTFTQDFVPTSRFSSSRKFTASVRFTKSNHFSRSIKFTKSNTMTKSKYFTKSGIFTPSTKMTRSSQFIRSEKFTKSNLFTRTNHFSSSKVFPGSNAFSRSKLFDKTGYFTVSGMFTPSNHMSNSDVFTMTSLFSASKEMTKSNRFILSSQFTQSNKHTQSSQFTTSLKFSKSKLFSMTAKLSESKYFTLSNAFTPSDIHSQSLHFTPSDMLSKSKIFSISDQFPNSLQMSRSEKFIKSDFFTASDFHGQSHHFTPSKKFSKSSMFSASAHFTKSLHMTNSEKFIPSNIFSKSVVSTHEFTDSKLMSMSKHFSKTNVYSESGLFAMTNTMTKSSRFTRSNKFTRSNDAEKSQQFSSTYDFTLTRDFTRTSQFFVTNNFSESDFMTASKVVDFGIDDNQKGPQAIVVNKRRRSVNIGIIAGIVIGIILLATLIIFLLVFLAKRREDEDCEDDGEYETGDGTVQTENQITMDNPLYKGEFEVEHDPFEFDFVEGDSVCQGGMNL